jgi:hypothetical protein
MRLGVILHTYQQPSEGNVNIERLMERLRVQSLIQRLRRQYGDTEAWDIVREAFEIEMRVPETKRREKKPVLTESGK